MTSMIVLTKLLPEVSVPLVVHARIAECGCASVMMYESAASPADEDHYLWLVEGGFVSIHLKVKRKRRGKGAVRAHARRPMLAELGMPKGRVKPVSAHVLTASCAGRARAAREGAEGGLRELSSRRGPLAEALSRGHPGAVRSEAGGGARPEVGAWGRSVEDVRADAAPMRKVGVDLELRLAWGRRQEQR